MEHEVELEKAKEQELIKEIRRLEKRNKDLLDQVNEDQMKLISISDAYDKLLDKSRKYKEQIEGAVSKLLMFKPKSKIIA